MELTVAKADLQKELQLCQGVVEKRSTIPILSNVLLKATDGRLQIAATDLDVTILSSCEAKITTLGMIALVGVGFWLGFIVLDGATYLLLVLILMFHYPLIRANALKALLCIPTTLVPILMFAGDGNIRWGEGLVMSAGSIAGGYIGARLTMHERAKYWIFRILVAVLILEIVHLSIQYAAPYIQPLLPYHF